ncbi:hypothetical protein LJC63_12320 [Ruminococcaceae bacterium OttesenSCG-928-L11]|nr:hypothetical protein [Ruminococcaceae bacterium OttesenSCG-928-L11]
MNMNETWLLENSNILIKHIFKKDGDYHNELLINDEVQYWLSQLKSRWENNEIGAVHGSHDYRMENILGKCSILGLSKEIPVFNQYMKFILDFLNRHINKLNDNELSFGKICSYRDYETVLSCFLPMLGYTDEQSVLYITEKG